jgi:hypothetical protein
MARDRKNRRSSQKTQRRYQKEMLLERMQQSQQEAEGGRGVLSDEAKVTLWRPKDGSHIIDIIPYLTGKNNVDGDKAGTQVHYTFKYWVHKGVGPTNRWFICPAKTWGEDCPICEHRQAMIDKGSDWDKNIKPLFPRPRNLYNIVCYDRGEEKKGVQVWDVSDHYFQKHIITLSKKPARGGMKEQQILFFDEEEGKSITFTIEPAKGQDDYPEYVGHAFDDRDYRISDEILDQAYCLDEIIHRPTYEEMEKAYFGKPESRARRGAFEEEEEKPRKARGRQREEPEEDPDEDENYDAPDTDELLEQLEECEDNDEIEAFCDEHGIDFPLKKNFKKNLIALKAVIEEMGEEPDEDEEPEEEELTAEDVEQLELKALKKLIAERPELKKLNPKKFPDIDDLRDEIIDRLGLDD